MKNYAEPTVTLPITLNTLKIIYKMTLKLEL